MSTPAYLKRVALTRRRRRRSRIAKVSGLILIGIVLAYSAILAVSMYNPQ